MSPAKVAALADLAPRWSVPASGPWTTPALEAAFGGVGPLRVDIGTGNGEATRAWAAQHPTSLILAIEVHQPGIAILLRDLAADGPDNVRVADADALNVVDHLSPGSVAEVRVLFPDPWPKRRHTGRRLVDAAFVHCMATVLAPGGRLHLATDWEDYADQMRAALATEPRLVPVAVPNPDEQMVNEDRWQSIRPPRPTTTYEGRGIFAGRAVTDLVAERRLS